MRMVEAYGSYIDIKEERILESCSQAKIIEVSSLSANRELSALLWVCYFYREGYTIV